MQTFSLFFKNTITTLLLIINQFASKRLTAITTGVLKVFICCFTLSFWMYVERGRERGVTCLQTTPKYHFTVISRCMYAFVPLDVTINLSSFQCVQCSSIKLQCIIDWSQSLRLAMISMTFYFMYLNFHSNASYNFAPRPWLIWAVINVCNLIITGP